MPQFSPSALLARLEKLAPPGADKALCIAYSGGLDSTVLLHAAARIAIERPEWRLRAAHVDHRLYVDSAQWSEHCSRVASSLPIEFVLLQVDAAKAADQSPEAAAREARYGALRKILRAGELLLTAHHADDQLETLLLALMRGAGLRGLSGMSAVQPFGAGFLVRPLLEFSRCELETWAVSAGLSWISDPSNENTAFDRNFLRHRVIPALRERWPAAAHSARRSAAHLLEAGELLDLLAAADTAAVSVGACLAVDSLQALDGGRRRNVLRYWIRQSGARAPSTRKLGAIEHDMLNARADRTPCVAWDDSEVRRHRGLLYCSVSHTPIAASELEWEVAAPIDLPAQLGRLRMEPARSGLAPDKLGSSVRIRFRIGGEVLQPAGHAHHRKLKKLLQSLHVLPWWRSRLPLIYSDGQLAAVADLWVAEQFAARENEPALRVVWENKPTIAAPRDSGV